MANDIRVYTLDEVADIICVSKRTLGAYIRAGKLKAVKVGRAWRITDKALNEFLQRGTASDKSDLL